MDTGRLHVTSNLENNEKWKSDYKGQIQTSSAGKHRLLSENTQFP